jgi:hypothetical protein
MNSDFVQDIVDYDSYALVWKAMDVLDEKFIKCINFHIGPCVTYWNTDEFDNLSIEDQRFIVTVLEKIK